MITSMVGYGNPEGSSRFRSPRASMTRPSGTDGIIGDVIGQSRSDGSVTLPRDRGDRNHSG